MIVQKRGEKKYRKGQRAVLGNKEDILGTKKMGPGGPSLIGDNTLSKKLDCHLSVEVQKKRKHWS